MPRTRSAGMPSVAATPSRAKCGFCDPVQTVTLSPLMSTTAQAGPMLACDWKGHSYSASITRAALLDAVGLNECGEGNERVFLGLGDPDLLERALAFDCRLFGSLFKTLAV